MASVLKDYLENIINCAIPRYEKLKYNLITDGPAIKTGRKIDGKDEWVRRINFGTLPNTGQKQVPAKLTLVKIKVTDITAMSRNSSDGAVNPLGFTHTLSLRNQIMLHLRNNNIIIDAADVDRSGATVEIDIYFVCIDDNYDPNA